MKENIKYKPRQEIKWPQNGNVEVGSDVDFVYVMRKDGNFAMSPIARRFATEYGLDEGKTKHILMEEYDTYFSKLADVLQWGYSPKGKMELHLYNPDTLDMSVREKIGNLPTVSLDPLMNSGVFELGVSRGFYLGGRKDFGQVSRPGTDSLSKQAQNISYLLAGTAVAVAEDDIFSGGSVVASLSELRGHGVDVKKLVAGIQVGGSSILSEMGVFVDSVVAYSTSDGTDIFDKVDLGDPRDYLLGASGLVIKLPNGNFARAPYILPFVSTTARAGIPQEMEKEFAMKVLQASLEFYISAGERIGKPILLKNMDPNFVVLMSEMYGFDSNTTMESVVVWSMDNLDKIADLTESLGEFQEELAHLELPKNIIFIDVNGTLIPEGSIDGSISDEELLSLKKALLLAEEKGFSVGLCSDSPLPQLQEFAAKLGISGPIIAENGNLVFNNGESLILRIPKSIEEIKIKILKLAEDHSYEQIDDSIAPEYGGDIVDQNSPYWSFGANRETSVIVFGPPEFVKDLGVSFANNADYSVDVSSENNYFAIHPGSNFRDNKGMTLNTLSAHGHNIIMIGNSVSDWVVPTSGVQCAFVADSRITEEIVEKTAYISDKPLVSGVVDIIKSIK